MKFSQWVIPDLKNYFPGQRHQATFLYSINFGHVKTRHFKQVSFCIIQYLSKHPRISPSPSIRGCCCLWFLMVGVNWFLQQFSAPCGSHFCFDLCLMRFCSFFFLAWVSWNTEASREFRPSKRCRGIKESYAGIWWEKKEKLLFTWNVVFRSLKRYLISSDSLTDCRATETFREQIIPWAYKLLFPFWPFFDFLMKCFSLQKQKEFIFSRFWSFRWLNTKDNAPFSWQFNLNFYGDWGCQTDIHRNELLGALECVKSTAYFCCISWNEKRGKLKFPLHSKMLGKWSTLKRVSLTTLFVWVLK